MGYYDSSKVYRIWDSSKAKIVITRDVIFQEIQPSASPPVSPASQSSLPVPVTVYFPSLQFPSLPPVSLTSLSVSSPSCPNHPTVPSPTIPSSASPTSLSDSSTDSLNPILHTRCLSDLLFDPPTTSPEADPHGRLDIPPLPRSSRLPKAPDRYGDWAFLSTVADESLAEPQNITEALSCAHKDKWLAAMQDEYSSLIQNQT